MLLPKLQPRAQSKLTTPQITPILSVLLVHDLLLAKRGIALPATHGLRTAIERHKGRLQAELTKARIRRKLSSLEALKAHVEAGLDDTEDKSDAPYPRWVRVNSLKTSLEDQLDTTFAAYTRVNRVDDVRKRGSRSVYIDTTIPNLLAVSPNTDLSKSEAYKLGQIIFQDKASCFPAYLLDPLAQDGDIIDTCSAPGNKTTHLAAILVSHASEPDDCIQRIHAFEKNKGRAETLEKMVSLAGSDHMTKLHPGQDFLKTDPNSPVYKRVGALLLDPSCSGSGIVGRDDMPELHLPILKEKPSAASKGGFKKAKTPDPKQETRKRKREEKEDLVDVLIDDDGVVTAVTTDDEMEARLTALATFQLDLLLHAFAFPSARKITYSTCSIHAEENENVVLQALKSPMAKERGWRILKRDEQIRGLREWPVRGVLEGSGGDEVVAEACIRANKGDEHGTMGFFVAGFVRDLTSTVAREDQDALFLRDEQGKLVRDVLGFPVRADTEEEFIEVEGYGSGAVEMVEEEPIADEDEWGGIEDEEPKSQKQVEATPAASSGQQVKKKNQKKADTIPATSSAQQGKAKNHKNIDAVPAASTAQQVKAPISSKHSYNANKKRADLVPQGKKRRKN